MVLQRGNAVDLPSALEDWRSAGLGVIACFAFDANDGTQGAGLTIAPEALDASLQALGHGGGFVWVHLNSRKDHGRSWLAACPHLPQAGRDFLLDVHAVPGRTEALPGGVLGCLSDLAYDFNGDPGEVRSFRFYLSQTLLLTVREDPISAADSLRLAIRDGRRFAGTLALLNALLEYQGDALRKIADAAEDRLERIEDRVFGGAQEVEEGAISRIRWLCGRLQRRFAPEQKILALLHRSMPAAGTRDEHEHLCDRIQQFDETLATLGDIQSRARLLQEEVNSRQASATSRNLYFLSIFTAIMLPVTLVTGVFGMNVAGLPGTKSDDAFLWVIGGMALLAVLTLLGMRLKRLI